MEAVKRLKRESSEHELKRGGSDSEPGSESDGGVSDVGNDELDSVSDSDSNIDPNLEFQVEFEAKSIEAGDFHGIRRLLKLLFRKANVDLSDLTDLIISQSSLCGSTIKIVTEEEGEGEDEEVEGPSEEEEEGSEIYGVTTFVGLTPKQDHCFAQQLKDYLLSQCKLHGTETNLKVLSEMLQEPLKPIGLLINEKVLNLPEQIGALALRTLLKELMTTNSACESVLVIARSHLVLSADVGQKRKERDIPQKEEHVFDFSENDFMLKESVLSFSYPVSQDNEVFGGSLDDTAVRPFRTVLVFPYSKLEHAIIALEKALDS